MTAIQMTRTLRHSILFVLMLPLLAMTVYGAVSMDLARDVFIARRVLDGTAWPLTGPILAGTLHLGPVWYYALAMLLFLVGGSWQLTTLAMGTFAALQIPLAYLVGKALLDRRLGLIWAALLIVPGWATFNGLLPSHPQLAAPLMLAFLLCVARYWRRPRRKYFFGMALCFTLALHAHPSSLALGWVGLIACLRACRRGECRAVDLIVAALIVALPLLPFLYWDATRGFADLGAAGTYATKVDLAANLANAGALLDGIAYGALRYWFDVMLAWPRWRANLAIALLALLSLPALFGLLRLLLARHTRPLVLFALGATAAALLSVAAIRDVTPFYMTTPVQVMLAGLLALGFAGLGDARLAMASRGSMLAAALLAGVLVTNGSAHFQVRGAWPFGWWPLIDAKHEPSPTTPLLLMPAYAMRASGRFLCSQPAPSVHGVYASHVVMNYEIDMRLACARHDVLGGGGEVGRQHWLGLSRALFAQLDVEPELRLGPLGVVRAVPFPPGRSIAPHTEPSYPSYTPPPAAMRESHTHVPLDQDEYLVVSDIALMFAGGYQIEASIDGRRLQPKARDAVSTVYACDACTPEAPATVDLVLRSGNLDALDVVVFRAHHSAID